MQSRGIPWHLLPQIMCTGRKRKQLREEALDDECAGVGEVTSAQGVEHEHADVP